MLASHKKMKKKKKEKIYCNGIMCLIFCEISLNQGGQPSLGNKYVCDIILDKMFINAPDLVQNKPHPCKRRGRKTHETPQGSF